MTSAFLPLLFLLRTHQIEGNAEVSTSSEVSGESNPIVSFVSCRAKLALSDRNRDDFLTLNEYVGFCNRLGSREWEDFELLPQSLKDNYNDLVIASEGVIEIYGAKPSQRDASTVQVDFLQQLCENTMEAIHEVQTLQTSIYPISKAQHTGRESSEDEKNADGGGDGKVDGDSSQMAFVDGEPIVLTIHSSFIISNQIGLSSDVLASGPNRRTLQKAFNDFVNDLTCYSLSSSTNDEDCINFSLSEEDRVRFSVDSPDVYQIVDIECSNTTASAKSNALCQTAFAHYVLEVFTNDPNHVYDVYVDATSKAIDYGLLQMHLRKEDSPLTAERSSSPVKFSNLDTTATLASTIARQGTSGENAGGIAFVVLFLFVVLVAAGYYFFFFHKVGNGGGSKKSSKAAQNKGTDRERKRATPQRENDHSDNFELYRFDETADSSQHTQNRDGRTNHGIRSNNCSFRNKSNYNSTNYGGNNQGTFRAPACFGRSDELAQEGSTSAQREGQRGDVEESRSHRESRENITHHNVGEDTDYILLPTDRRDNDMEEAQGRRQDRDTAVAVNYVSHECTTFNPDSTDNENNINQDDDEVIDDNSDNESVGYNGGDDFLEDNTFSSDSTYSSSADLYDQEAGIGYEDSDYNSDYNAGSSINEDDVYNDDDNFTNEGDAVNASSDNDNEQTAENVQNTGAQNASVHSCRANELPNDPGVDDWNGLLANATRFLNRRFSC